MTKRAGTGGQFSQPTFDTLISDLKEEELDVLRIKYNKDLLDFRKTMNMGLPSNQKLYLEMQQRIKMIYEERYNRKQWSNVLDYDLDDE
jgi:hypothetical protein